MGDEMEMGPMDSDPVNSSDEAVEAVAERSKIVAVIEHYLPEALGFNTLPEIVGGIARQRDWQRELKDHLADVARRLTDERDKAIAEAVADERRRIDAEIRQSFPPSPRYMPRDTYNGMRDAFRVALDIVAAGSVSVATPPAEPAQSWSEPNHDVAGDMRRAASGLSATPRPALCEHGLTGSHFEPIASQRYGGWCPGPTCEHGQTNPHSFQKLSGGFYYGCPGPVSVPKESSE